jgi:hypothetical protein
MNDAAITDWLPIAVLTFWFAIMIAMAAIGLASDWIQKRKTKGAE